MNEKQNKSCSDNHTQGNYRRSRTLDKTCSANNHTEVLCRQEFQPMLYTRWRSCCSWSCLH